MPEGTSRQKRDRRAENLLAKSMAIALTPPLLCEIEWEMNPKSQPQLAAGMPIWIVLGLLAVATAFLGGSSRQDMPQLIGLRPLVAMFLIPILYSFNLNKANDLRVIFLLLALFFAWSLLQLVPLPPDIWQALPGREPIAQLDILMGRQGDWRPINMAPSRGWNSLASLIVPLAAILLAANAKVTERMLLLCIAGLGSLNALLALAQLATQSSTLYFYRVTNAGGAVGLFANENHSAAFSAVTLIVTAFLMSSRRRSKDPFWLSFAYPTVFVLILLAILVNGSRAGLALGAVSALSALLIFRPARSRRKMISNKEEKSWVYSPSQLVAFAYRAAVFILLGLIILFMFIGAVPALDDILTQDPFDDLRSLLFPTMTGMLGTFWLVGTGSGAFKDAYHQFEPTEYLLPSYVNQAHNDWLQIGIEGGLPALLILAGLIFWITKKKSSILFREGLLSPAFVLWSSSLVVIAAASLVDYPLRTPLFQLVGVWLLASLAIRVQKERARGA